MAQIWIVDRAESGHPGERLWLVDIDSVADMVVDMLEDMIDDGQ